jgi:peroxiredoxin
MSKLQAGMKAPDFTYQTPWSDNHTLYGTIDDKTTILMFLRYYGCRICQLDISRLIAGYDRITELNAQLLVVLQTEPEVISEHDKEEDIPFAFICDPEHELYELYEVGAPTAEEAGEMSSAVKEKLEIALSQGFIKYENNGKEIQTQVPACFIIGTDGILQYVHYGIDVADLPGVNELVEILTP